MNFGVYLSRWISSILLCDYERNMIIEPRTKHKTLSYRPSLAVIGSQVCTTNTVAAVDVFSQGPCCAKQAFKYQENNVFSVAAQFRVLILAGLLIELPHTTLPATW